MFQQLNIRYRGNKPTWANEGSELLLFSQAFSAIGCSLLSSSLRSWWGKPHQFKTAKMFKHRFDDSTNRNKNDVDWLQCLPTGQTTWSYRRNTLNPKCIHNLGNFYKLLNQPHEYGIPAGSWMSYWPGASAESQTPGSWPGQTHWWGSLQGQGWLGISELENVAFADGIPQHLDGNINAEHRSLKLFTLGTLKEIQKT